MRSTSSTQLRKNLAAELDRVIEDRVPLVVHRNGNKGAVVVVPLEDYSVDETEYLMSSAENHKRLVKAIRDLDRGVGGKVRQLTK